MKKIKVSFPHMGNYYVAFKPMIELIADEVIIPPPITKKTMDLGAKYSPEFVCVPFKYHIGNYIESLELGANVIVQAGGGCRFGMYGEVQESILKKLGYDFTFIKIGNSMNPGKFIKTLQAINPKLSGFLILKTFWFSFQRMKCIEEVEDFVRKNIGFENQKGKFENLHKIFLNELEKTKSLKQIKAVKTKYKKLFKSIEISRPKDVLRVGIVGELYIVME
ncbi:MAG: hypothetical protein WCJ58_07930, partial [bacterium]